MAIINNYPTYLRVTTQNLARAFFITKPFTVVKYNDTTIKIEDSFYENVIIKTDDLTGFTFTGIDDLINQLRIISTNTDQISVVNTYSDLPDPTTLPNRFFFVRVAEGTKWLPGSFGGTYYPNGTYYSDGAQWISNVDLYTSIQKITGSVTIANPTPSPETGLAKQITQTDGTQKTQVTNFPATQPVSAVSLPLPTGASVESKQDTQITILTEVDLRIGSLTETAPVTDTASSGLNGRLQRIAQRITSLITALGSPFQAGGSIGNTSFGITNWLGSTAPTVGQKTAANSVPVVIASDQSIVATVGGVTDIIQEISVTGQYRGKTAYCYNIMGRRVGFTSTSAFNDVKEYDNAVANMPVLSNSTLDIISSSVNDTAAGTGARTVKVTYIDNSNNLIVSPAITLNGTTLVTSVLTGVNFILWMETETAGSGGVAAGNIRLRINGGAVEVEQITAGGNKSLSSQFMVPAGYKGYIPSWNGSAVNNDQDLRLRATVNTQGRTLSSVYHFVDNLYIALNTSQFIELPFLRFPALTKIKTSTISAGAGGTVRVDVSFIIIIIQD